MKSPSGAQKSSTLFWGNLLHLSYNMWSDVPLAPGERRVRGKPRIVEELYFDTKLWHDVTERMARSGFNAVVIDLGDGVKYDSHPEIAVRNAWSTDRLRSELARLRQLGLEPIPKLNFSAAHDAWLKDYSRMVSTPRYYEVCSNLIREVAALFDGPRLFHLGMDEETFGNQRAHQCVVIRQGNLWWHDLRFLAEEVTRTGARPWTWSDPAWHLAGEFYRRMPKEVLQSNWWYGLWFEGDESNRPRPLAGHEGFLTHLDLDEQGFEQIPTASTWQNRFENFPMTVEFCLRRLDPARLRGFLQTTWLMTTETHREEHLMAVEIAAKTIRDYEEGKFDRLSSVA